MYKRTALISVVTSVYGLYVNTRDNWKNRHAITDLADLTERHRVSVLCASTKHWWHKPSKFLMNAFINRLTVDMKTLANNEDFRGALEMFNLEDNCVVRVRNLHEKIQTSVKLELIRYKGMVSTNMTQHNAEETIANTSYEYEYLVHALKWIET